MGYEESKGSVVSWTLRSQLCLLKIYMLWLRYPSGLHTVLTVHFISQGLCIFVLVDLLKTKHNKGNKTKQIIDCTYSYMSTCLAPHFHNGMKLKCQMSPPPISDIWQTWDYRILASADSLILLINVGIMLNSPNLHISPEKKS